MSTTVPIEDIEDYDNVEKTLNKMCVCNHVLSNHGFTDNYDYYTHGHYFRVSQCLMCDCKEFKEMVDTK